MDLASGTHNASAYFDLLSGTAEAFLCPENWSPEACQAAGETYWADAALQEAARAQAALQEAAQADVLHEASPYGRMEQFLLTLVDSVEGGAAYGLIFGILLICGLGVPIPEDISLTLGGFLAHQGRATLWGMMMTGYLGIIIGDSIIYAIGRQLGSNVGTRPKKGFFGRLITPEKRAKVEKIFEKYGDKVVMVARFMPGIRAVTYFIAGSVRLKYGRFLFYDSVAALASAPIFVFLGWYFGGELETLFKFIKEGKTWALALVVLAVLLWMGVWFWKKLRMRRLSAKVSEVNNVQRKEYSE